MKRPMLQGTLGGAESHPNPCKLRNESFAARASDEPPLPGQHCDYSPERDAEAEDLVEWHPDF